MAIRHVIGHIAGRVGLCVPLTTGARRLYHKDDEKSALAERIGTVNSIFS